MALKQWLTTDVVLSDTELDLIDRCKRGDRRAWGDLYKTYARDVELFIRGVLGHRNDTEDLVQQVFLELLASLDRFRGHSSLRTWLHRIAHNLVRKRYRSAARQAHHLGVFATEVDTSSADVHAQAEAREDLALVEAALAELKLEFREVWVMREVEGLSVDEVSDALGLRKATVRTRHHRARSSILEAIASAERPRRRALAGRGLLTTLVVSILGGEATT